MLPETASQHARAAARPYDQLVTAQAAFLRKVYAFMAGGLGATALTALVVANSESAQRIIFGSRGVFMVLLLVELGLVFALRPVARRMSWIAAASVFYLYSILNGLTLSVIFLVYTRESIASTMFVAAGMFGGMSVYGFVTKRNLLGMGHYLYMTLWGLIIAGVVNIFVGSSSLSWLTSIVGVGLFVALTAYDVQKLKELYVAGTADQENKDAIHGALELYLDFVNLFLYLLRFFGRRR
jgi:FtsH-binding integral membrane protein